MFLHYHNMKEVRLCEKELVLHELFDRMLVAQRFI